MKPVMRPDRPMLKGLEEYIWEHETFAFGVVCWMEVDPEERETWDCPGAPMTATVVDAFCGGVSIRGILQPELLNQIEDDFLASVEADAKEWRKVCAAEDHRSL